MKIVWNLRADPIDGQTSTFRTETRAVATDKAARARCRWYWAFFSPGIWTIRKWSLGKVRAEARRRAATASLPQGWTPWTPA